jgi:hypothetical protein
VVVPEKLRLALLIVIFSAKITEPKTSIDLPLKLKVGLLVTPVQLMFLREEASESTVIVCPLAVKENLSK